MAEDKFTPEQAKSLADFYQRANTQNETPAYQLTLAPEDGPHPHLQLCSKLLDRDTLIEVRVDGSWFAGYVKLGKNGWFLDVDGREISLRPGMIARGH